MDDVRIGSIWRHRSGDVYFVIAVANNNPDEEPHPRYPMMILYGNYQTSPKGPAPHFYAAPLDDWHRRMTLLTDADILALPDELRYVVPFTAGMLAAQYSKWQDAFAGVTWQRLGNLKSGAN